MNKVQLAKSRLLQTAVAFLGCTFLASIIVALLVGLPRGEVSLFGYAASIFVMCFLGPLLFAWAVGPGAMGLLPLTAAVLLPGLSLCMLYFGYWRRRSRVLLWASAAVWGGFGGFSAWVAILGSV